MTNQTTINIQQNADGSYDLPAITLMQYVPPVPPVSPSPPPVSPPPPPAGTSSFNFVRGLGVINPVYPAALPSVGGSWSDPTTGASIERFTDNAAESDDGGALRNVYSRYPCESSDGKYVLVYGVGSPTSYVYDSTSGKRVRELVDINGKPFGEGSDIRWSYADPSVLIYHVGMKLYKQDVSTGVNVLVRDFSADFPGAGGIANGEEGNSSYDGRYWAFMAQVLDGNGYYPIAIFVYDMQDNKIIGSMTPTSPGVTQGATDAKHNPPWPMPNPNMCEISPDGKWALIDWNRCWGTGNDPNSSVNANLIGTHMDGPHAYPLDLDTTKAVKVGVDATHSAWALSAAGVWGFASQNNRNDWIEWVDPNGAGYHDDGTGVVRMLNQSALGWNTGYHFAGAAGMPGWVLMSTYSSTQADPGDNQLMLLPLTANCDPLRVSPTYGLHDGQVQDKYFQEAAACITGDGLRIYWPGNFGGKVKTDVYRIVMPADWQTHVQPAH